MTKNIIGLVTGVLVLGAATTGCSGAAWTMRRGAWSGELALHGPIVDAQYAAHDQMIAHCGGRVRLVEGAEAERVALADASTRPPREVTVDTTGRRVHYVCVSRAPMEFRQGHEASEQTVLTARATQSGL
jgi:hypothetical protein